MEDLIIRGGTVVDGSGAPGFRSDVAVRDGRITGIGVFSGTAAKETLDAGGLTVSPGFIDAHAHSDTAFLLDSSCASKLYQGITTEISGNCGSSPFPFPPEQETADVPLRCASFDAFVRRFGSGGYSMATHQLMLVGHGTLRASVMGYADRRPSAGELERMKALLDRDLKAGAWGMSLGLEYAPGFFAEGDELRELARVVRKYDGLVPCHLRSEGLRIGAALRELFGIGRETGAHVHVSHLKLDHRSVHGQAEAVWNAVEQARLEGVRVTADVYPYAASNTTLSIRCPHWCLEGGDEMVVRHLRGDRRGEILACLRAHYATPEQAETCLVSNDFGYWPEIVGKTLRSVAEDLLKTGDYAEAAAEILTRTQGKAWCVFFVMDERDMRCFLSHETMIGSDGSALPGDPDRVPGSPHPRYYGAIAEFFRLNRLHRFCSVEQAVRRVTSLPAGNIGLARRGLIKPGYAADITVFDPETIAPRATYREPVQLAAGVRHVVVNGQTALKDGRQTDRRAGRFLRKTEEG